METHKRIILCADDYALNPAINQGILNLLEDHRIRCVSCFSCSPFWSDAGKRLLDLGDNFDAGLHFNLTEPFDGLDYIQKLPYWVFIPALSKKTRKLILEIFHRQLCEFERVMGRLPSYIDGHQHVHALPIIRTIIEDYLVKHSLDERLFIRSLSPLYGPIPLLKGNVIRLLTSIGHTTIKSRFKSNKGFCGVYSLSSDENYPSLFSQWLRKCPDYGLIMCHPGLGNDDSIDPIAQTRNSEYIFLSSRQYIDLCRRNNILISSFTDILQRKTGVS